MGQEGLVNLWNTKSEIPAFSKAYFQVATGFFPFGKKQAFGKPIATARGILHTQGAQLTSQVMVLHVAENGIKI